MPNVGTLTAHLAMDTSRLKQGRVEMGRFVKGANRGLGSVTSSVGKLAASFATMAGAFAAFRLIKNITQVGEEFEQTITTAGAVMRATTEEMQALNDIAREMGETTEFTASQAAGSLKFLGMAGFEASKAMTALPGTLDLATAGGIDLGRAADIATNALTAMRLDVDQLGRVNDVFVGTITRSNTNMEQMAQAFKFAAPIAASYGYEIEELSGLIGSLGNAGVQGSMAGTQLAQAFIEAKQIARDFGFESSDLIDVLDSLKMKFGENVDMMEFFTKRSGRASLILSDAGDKVKDFQETLGGVAGEAKALADKMRATFGGVRKELVSVMESIKIDAFGLYRDSLKDTMRDTIKWLRDNREQILVWVQGIIDAFKITITATKDFVLVIAKSVEGLGLIFDAVQMESRATAKIVAEDADSIANAFMQMNTTPFEEFMHQLGNVWNAAVSVVTAIAEAFGTTIGTLAAWLIDDVIVNIRDAIGNLALAVAAFLRRDFTGAWNFATKGVDNIIGVWDSAAEAGDDVIQGWADAYVKMIDGFDFGSKAGKIIDEEFKKSLADANEKSKLTASALDVHRGRIHTAKDPGVSVLGDDNEEIKAAQKAAQKLLDVRVDLLADMLIAEGLSKDERLEIWNDYEAARIEQIKSEGQMLMDMGVEVNLITETIATRMAELNEEQRELFTEQAGWLNEWAEELSAEMNATFSDMFFDTMKGEWQGLTEYMFSIWDVFLRKIADSAANELSGIFNGDDGWLGKISGWLGGGDSIPKLAAGGLVNRPTLAMVGESGPEAVIPLGKMRDENFLAGFGMGGGNEGNVSITIQTPDLPSFQRSQSQIMTHLAAGLRQASMRNS